MPRPRLSVSSIALAVLFVGMLLLTYLGNSAIRRILFSDSSADYMLTAEQAPAALQVLWLSLAGVLLYRCAQRLEAKRVLLFALVGLCWGLSGRTVGIMLSPEGKVYAGWFYLRTDRFRVCPSESECEATIYQTTAEPLPFWRVRIKNAHFSRVLFIGPMNWTPTLTMLQCAFNPNPSSECRAQRPTN